MAGFDDFLKSKSGGAASAPTPAPAQPPAMPSPAQASPSSSYVPPPVSTPGWSAPPIGPSPAASVPASAQTPTNLRDCRPVMRHNPGSVWSTMEQQAVALYDGLKRACNDLGITGYLGRSNRFEFPQSVRFEAWIPSHLDPAVTERVEAVIALQAKPYHRHEIEYVITTTRWGKQRHVGTFSQLPQTSLVAIIKYLCTGQRAKLKLPFRLRDEKMRSILRWFYERNKQTALRRDWLALGVTTLLLIGPMLFSLAVASNTEELAVLALPLTLVGLISLVVMFFVRRNQIRSSGKPDAEPRFLRFFDAWQVVIFGAGKQTDEFRKRILAALNFPPMPDVRHEVETLQYRAPEGLVEREQIVVRHRRGIIYCQIYPFGNDVYLGWQSFLNTGCWTEAKLSSGIDRVTGQPVILNTAVPGVHGLNEYDLADLNFLSEWTHAQYVSVTKLLVKQLQIDQEIDFQIVRGERRGIQSANQAPKEETVAKKIGGLFKRKS